MCWSTTWRRERIYWTHLGRLSWYGSHELLNPYPCGTEICGWSFRENDPGCTPADNGVALPKEAQSALGGLPKKCCTEHTMTSLCKRKGYNHTGRQGRAGTAMPHCWTGEAGNALVRTQKTLKEKQDKDAIELGSCWKQCWLSRGLRETQGVLPSPGSSRKYVLEGQLWFSGSVTGQVFVQSTG